MKKSAYLHRTYKTSLASSTDSQKDVNLLSLALFVFSIDDTNMKPEIRFRHPAPDPAKTSKSRLSGASTRLIIRANTAYQKLIQISALIWADKLDISHMLIYQ